MDIFIIKGICINITLFCCNANDQNTENCCKILMLKKMVYQHKIMFPSTHNDHQLRTVLVKRPTTEHLQLQYENIKNHCSYWCLWHCKPSSYLGKIIKQASFTINVYCFMAHRQLRSFSAQLNLFIHDPWVNKPVLG